MKLLLDTHAFLWLINDDYASLRGKAAVDLFLADDSMPFLSLASVWEMAIKIRLGKFDLQQPLAEFIPNNWSAIKLNCYRLDWAISCRRWRCPFITATHLTFC